MKQETEKLLDPSAARIVAYLDGLPPDGVLRNRQAKVNAPPAHAFGRLRSAMGEEWRLPPMGTGPVLSLSGCRIAFWMPWLDLGEPPYDERRTIRL